METGLITMIDDLASDEEYAPHRQIWSERSTIVFQDSGFSISSSGIEAVPLYLLPSTSRLIKAALHLNRIKEYKYLGFRALDIACSPIRQAYDIQSHELYSVQYFYTSGSAGCRKCCSLLEILLQFKDSKFILGLVGAIFDSVMDRVLVFLDPAPSGHLRHILSRCAPIPPPIASFLLGRLLDALIWLHRDCGYVHNSLTTYNIFVDASMQVRMGGLQLTVQNREVLNTTDAELDLLGFGGDPTFAAPERLHGLESSFASDVWSIGMIAYELFANMHILSRFVEVIKCDWTIGVSQLKEEISMSNPAEKSVLPFCKDKIFLSVGVSNHEHEESVDFIESCLMIRPEDRSTAQELRNSEFIRRHENLGEDILRSWLENPRVALPQSSYNSRKNVQANSTIVGNALKEKEGLSLDSQSWKDQRVKIDRYKTVVAQQFESRNPSVRVSWQRFFSL